MIVCCCFFLLILVWVPFIGRRLRRQRQRRRRRRKKKFGSYSSEKGERNSRVWKRKSVFVCKFGKPQSIQIKSERKREKISYKDTNEPSAYISIFSSFSLFLTSIHLSAFRTTKKNNEELSEYVCEIVLCVCVFLTIFFGEKLKIWKIFGIFRWNSKQ